MEEEQIPKVSDLECPKLSSKSSNMDNDNNQNMVVRHPVSPAHQCPFKSSEDSKDGDVDKGSTVGISILDWFPDEILLEILRGVLKYDQNLAPWPGIDEKAGIATITYSVGGVDYTDDQDNNPDWVENRLEAIRLTCKKFDSIGSEVFFKENTFSYMNDQSRDPFPQFHNDPLLGGWISSLTPNNRSHVRSLDFAWSMVSKHGEYDGYIDVYSQVMEKLFKKIILLPNLTTLDIDVHGSHVGHTPQICSIWRNSIRYPSEQSAADVSGRRIWMDSIIGGAEIKSLPKLKDVTVRGCEDDKISGLALQEFLGGPAIPARIMDNQLKYGWQNEYDVDYQPPYGTDNILHFTIPNGWSYDDLSSDSTESDSIESDCSARESSENEFNESESNGSESSESNSSDSDSSDSESSDSENIETERTIKRRRLN